MSSLPNEQVSAELPQGNSCFCTSARIAHTFDSCSDETSSVGRSTSFNHSPAVSASLAVPTSFEFEALHSTSPSPDPVSDMNTSSSLASSGNAAQPLNRQPSVSFGDSAPRDPARTQQDPMPSSSTQYNAAGIANKANFSDALTEAGTLEPQLRHAVHLECEKWLRNAIAKLADANGDTLLEKLPSSILKALELVAKQTARDGLHEHLQECDGVFTKVAQSISERVALRLASNYASNDQFLKEEIALMRHTQLASLRRLDVLESKIAGSPGNTA